jgi:hypothetical protein
MRKVDQVVHVHSNIELALLRLAEYAKNFYGVCDQCPLPRDVTLGAAESLGVRHPTYSVSHAPVVMTFDFVFDTVSPDGEIIRTPWDVKREADLKTPRTLEKLSIHRVAAAHLGWAPARIFTELSAPKQVVRNVEWIRATLPLEGEPDYVHQLYETEQDAVLNDILRCGPRHSIAGFCQDYDARKGFEHGTALRVVGWLLWAHRLPIDLRAPNIPQQPLRMPVTVQTGSVQ